mmetsp:Transcript_27656/g.69991  ORF Transcript_27656/g.69991 Transcript_27656/m.69991 type:complete len:570 (-) Transcript_27656:484-2193(-)
MGSGRSRQCISCDKTEGPPTELVAATDKRLRYLGRHVQRNAAVCFDWPATGVAFMTSAKKVTFRMDGGRNFFNVFVNGERVTVLKTRSGLKDYTVTLSAEGRSTPGTGESAAAAFVELRKRTEAKLGTTLGTVVGRVTRPVSFSGLGLEGGSLEPLPEPRARRVEFLGDSETAAFGNLGPSQPQSVTPGWKTFLAVDPADQDVHQGWPAFVSEELDVDYHVIAWSGIGVLWNCSATASGNFNDLYPRVLGNEAGEAITATPANNVLSGWVPDVVAIYLGGNDWYSLDPASNGELTEAFCQLLTQVRALRPESKIVVLLASEDSFCACIGSAEEQKSFSEDMARCWKGAVAQINDPKIVTECVAPSPKIEGAQYEDWGQMAHWSVQGHRKWAKAAAPVIAKHLGMEPSGEAKASHDAATCRGEGSCQATEAQPSEAPVAAAAEEAHSSPPAERPAEGSPEEAGEVSTEQPAEPAPEVGGEEAGDASCSPALGQPLASATEAGEAVEVSREEAGKATEVSREEVSEVPPTSATEASCEEEKTNGGATAKAKAQPAKAKAKGQAKAKGKSKK